MSNLSLRAINRILELFEIHNEFLLLNKMEE